MGQAPDLINRIITLEDSTTFLLESLSTKPLKVLLESQTESNDSHDNIIKRTVKLFFDSGATPVLFCVSELHRRKLKTEEYRLLSETLMPIGRIFHLYNKDEHIKKMNIKVTRSVDPDMAALLNVKFTEVICKKYDYCVGDRKIGSICEYFNEESLIRVWDTKSIKIL